MLRLIKQGSFFPVIIIGFLSWFRHTLLHSCMWKKGSNPFDNSTESTRDTEKQIKHDN